MTLNACILIKTTPTDVEDVLKSVRKLKGSRKSFQAYGRYDIVAFIEAPDYQSVKNLTGQVNSIDGVRSTETLVEA